MLPIRRSVCVDDLYVQFMFAFVVLFCYYMYFVTVTVLYYFLFYLVVYSITVKTRVVANFCLAQLLLLLKCKCTDKNNLNVLAIYPPQIYGRPWKKE